MNTCIGLFCCAFLLAGCGRSDDDIRALVRDEMSAMASRTSIMVGEPIGPYTPAVRVGPLLFLSGQIGLVPHTRELAGTDIEA
ncbi:MAG: hypothetical protein WD295_03370, partial [Bacteroidota bacterium]